MNIESYIKAGDEISVIFRSLALIGFCGTVLEVREGEPGAREIVIERADDCAVGDRIARVREDQAVFSVCRGDSWVDVPCLLSLAEAEAKAGRAVVNEQKRIQKKVPLFADQVPVNTRSADEWVEGARCTGDENLAARHKAALHATMLRTMVSQRVTPSEYETLVGSRQRYPRSGTYGVIFWQKQLDHIEREGTPDILVPKVTLATMLSFPWLKSDAELTWMTAPGGPKRVRALFIGSESIMAQIIGEPFTDYDPGLVPRRNNWIKPHEFAEAGELSTPPTVEAPATNRCENWSVTMQNDEEQKLPRLFTGVFPCGISYADRHHEEHGDYKSLAFLPYSSLVLEFRKDCPAELRGEIIASAAAIQARKGEQYQISGCGQNVLLGGEKRA